MTRVQVQLTDQQIRALKKRSAATGRSVADLVREGVDRFLGGDQPDRARLLANSLRSMGKFASGRRDVGRNHDRYLAEDFAK